MYITCLFVTEFGFNVMYRCHYSSGYLMGLTAPNLIMHGLRTVTKVLVKHFEGLEECDEGIRTAVLDFAYYLWFVQSLNQIKIDGKLICV